jgi:putative membrane protein
VLTTIRSWFDPPAERAVGPTPDYRFSLANERTFLAWIRTGLAFVGGGLAVAQLLPAGRLRTLLAIALLGVGGGVAVRAVDHWARVERAIRLGEDLPRSRFPATLALVIALGAAGLVAILLLRGAGR